MRDGVCLALLVIAGAGLYAFESASLIYALLAIAGLCGLVSPAAAIAAILVATPLVQRPIQIGDSSWQVLEMSILLALSALSIRLLLDAVRAPSFRPCLRLLEPFRFTALALALVVIGVFTIFTVADERFRPDSIRELRWVIVEPVAGLFLFRWAARNSYRKLIVGAFVVTGIAVAGYGLVQLALGRGVVIADGVERATGLYRHPNNLALYLDRVAIFCLALAIAVRSRHRLLVPAAGITSVGLAATLSRGAAIAFVVGAIWIVVVLGVRHGWRWIGAGVIAGSLVIGIVGAERITDRGSSGNHSSRELIWSSSFEMLRDYPVNGIGLDQFLNQYGRRYVEPAGWPERYTSHPHNVFLDFWLSLGLAGLALLAVSVTLIGKQAVSLRSTARQKPLQLAAMAALISGAAHGLVDNSFFLPDLAVMTWFLIALIERPTLLTAAGSDGE